MTDRDLIKQAGTFERAMAKTRQSATTENVHLVHFENGAWVGPGRGLPTNVSTHSIKFIWTIIFVKRRPSLKGRSSMLITGNPLEEQVGRVTNP
jgi:hypothetical protein